MKAKHIISNNLLFLFLFFFAVHCNKLCTMRSDKLYFAHFLVIVVVFSSY